MELSAGGIVYLILFVAMVTSAACLIMSREYDNRIAGLVSVLSWLVIGYGLARLLGA